MFKTQDFLWGFRVVFILKRSDFDTTLFFSYSRTGKVWPFWTKQHCLYWCICNIYNIYVYYITYIYVYVYIYVYIFFIFPIYNIWPCLTAKYMPPWLWNYLIVLFLYLSNKHHILLWEWFKSLIAKCGAKLKAAFNRYFTIKTIMK